LAGLESAQLESPVDKIQAGAANDIRLALPSSMAANSSSDDSVTDFIDGFPIVHFQVRANVLTPLWSPTRNGKSRGRFG